MKESKIKYNPRVSVAENAKRNGVTERAIRRYIEVHEIDRNYDNAIKLIAACRVLYKKDTSITPYQMAKKTPHSLNTIKKYWKYITGEDVSKIATIKRQKMTLREYNDYYATHPSVTQDLLKVESFSENILEPFCGTGSISDVLEENGYIVEKYDLIDRGNNKVQDFRKLEVEPDKYDIITNPPYTSELIDHILKCIRVCKKKVAILMPLRYLTGLERYTRLFKDNPPARVYVYQNNILIGKGGDFTKKLGGLVEYAWFVWEKGYKEETRLRWLYNAQQQHELKV